MYEVASTVVVGTPHGTGDGEETGRHILSQNSTRQLKKDINPALHEYRESGGSSRPSDMNSGSLQHLQRLYYS
jgi:hypothetical protein